LNIYEANLNFSCECCVPVTFELSFALKDAEAANNACENIGNHLKKLFEIYKKHNRFGFLFKNFVGTKVRADGNKIFIGS